MITLIHLRTWSVVAVLLIVGATSAFGQEDFDGASVVAGLNSLKPLAEPTVIRTPWWNQHVSNSFQEGRSPVQVDLHNLFFLALKNSAQLRVYSDVPLIRETAVGEAAAAFDWSKYLDGKWEDIDVPVGSSLTVGGAGSRFEDHHFNITGGLKRKTFSGATIDIAQRFGHQNTNSNFFVPNDQATSRMTLGVTIPLLKGSGKCYNQSLFVLAGIDVESAELEFSRQLQSHLLEVARGYWSLCMERAVLAQEIKLFLRTKSIRDDLVARRGIDSTPAQLASAEAAFENRNADLVRANAAVKNAETRLRALINSAELGEPEDVELIPVQAPSTQYFDVALIPQIEVALKNRPEIAASLAEIKAASVRLGMSKHELLPTLDLVTQAYLSGLRGNSDQGQAWLDQFSRTPSYSIGLRYEIPIGNRAASARKQRREIELRQLKSQYRSSMETVRAEVEVAVREISTSYREMMARYKSVVAAEKEAKTLEERWNGMGGNPGAASLALEGLLRAQERVAQAEEAYSRSQLTYNLAVLNLSRSNGTLLETESIVIGKAYVEGMPETILDKPIPNVDDVQEPLSPVSPQVAPQNLNRPEFDYFRK